MTVVSVPALDELVGLLVAGNEPTIGYSGIYEDLAPDTPRRWRVWRLRAMGRIEEGDSRRLHFTAVQGTSGGLSVIPSQISWSEVRIEPALTEAFFEPGPDTLPPGSWPRPAIR